MNMEERKRGRILALWSCKTGSQHAGASALLFSLLSLFLLSHCHLLLFMLLLLLLLLVFARCFTYHLKICLSQQLFSEKSVNVDDDCGGQRRRRSLLCWEGVTLRFCWDSRKLGMLRNAMWSAPIRYDSMQLRYPCLLLLLLATLALQSPFKNNALRCCGVYTLLILHMHACTTLSLCVLVYECVCVCVFVH